MDGHLTKLPGRDGYFRWVKIPDCEGSRVVRFLTTGKDEKNSGDFAKKPPEGSGRPLFLVNGVFFQHFPVNLNPQSGQGGDFIFDFIADIKPAMDQFA